MNDKKITVELTDYQAMLLAALCSDVHQDNQANVETDELVEDFKKLEDTFDNARLGRG